MTCSVVAESVDDREHGGPDHRELERLGLEPRSILDFSVNVNPYGPGETIERAIRNAPMRAYPDPECWAARRALGARFAVDPDRIIVGHGATELLWLLGRIFGARGRRVLFVEPTFSEMRAAVRASGGECVEWRASEQDGFAIHLEAVARAARESAAGTIYLCLPASPTGQYLPMRLVAEWVWSLRTVQVVVDQAFLGLSDAAADMAVSLPDNAVVVRSLTKELGIPGVRIGYAFAHPILLEAMHAQRPRWTVSSAAQAAVVAACEHADVIDQSRTRMLSDKTALVEALARVDLHPLASSTPYVVVRLPLLASSLRRVLLCEHRILVRDCRSFGMPNHFRVCARPLEDVQRLEAALARVL